MSAQEKKSVENRVNITAQNIEPRVIDLMDIADTLENPNQSLELLRSAFPWIDQMSDSSKAKFYYLLGVGHGMLYHMDTSKLYFEKSIRFAKQSGSILPQLGSLNGLANLARVKSDNEIAQQFYEDGLALAESGNTKLFISWRSRILGNLAGIFFDLGNYQSGLDYSSRAYQNAVSISDSSAMALNLIQSGYCLIKLNKTESAMEVNLVATEILEKIDDQYLLIFQYYNLGEILLNSGDAIQSKKYFLESIELATKFNEVETLADCLNALAEISLATNNLTKTHQLINQSLELSIANGLLLHQQKSYHLAYQTELKLKNFERAIDQLSRYYELKDSIQRNETFNSIEEFRVKYETAKKEGEIEFLNKTNEVQNVQLEKNKNQRVFLLIISLCITALALIVYSFYRSRTKKNKQLRELNSSKDKLFSIVAHDLKGPISAFNSISSSLFRNITKMSEEDKKHYLNQLSESSEKIDQLLQNLLHWAVSQREGIEFQPNNFNLKKLTDRNVMLFEESTQLKNISLMSSINENTLINGEESSIDVIIRNLLSNAVKFTDQGGKIEISASENGEFVSIQIEDTGIGLSESDITKLFKIDVDTSVIGSSKEKGTGLGLILCKEFIDRNQGQIQVTSELGKGTIFTVKLRKGDLNGVAGA